MKNLLLLILWTITSTSTIAQNNPQPVQNFSQHPRAYTTRNSFWTEINFNGSITKDKKWQYSLDYQYRRMADASYIEGGNHGNIFKDPFQQVWRPWVHYWIKPGAVRFSLSPIGYWMTWIPSEEPASNPQGSKGRLIYPEIRTCPQITFNSKIGKLEIQQRYRYEFRWIGSRHESNGFFKDLGYGYDFTPNGIYGSNHKGRLRYMLKFLLPLNNPTLEKKTLYATVWNELFLNIGRHVGNSNLIDQNRTIALLGYKLNTEVPIRVEVGYTLQQAYKFNMTTPPTQPTITYNKSNVELNSAFQIYVIFDEFHQFFKKKIPAKPIEEK